MENKHEHSPLILGCMRIGEQSERDLEALIETAIQNGITRFDHADIYGGGKCETLFGSVLKNAPHLREQIQLQSKCGIRTGFYDLSKTYIVRSVDEILERLSVEQLDYLLLHRPDALMDPEEVAEAFEKLHQTGKVCEFGVSNFNTHQIQLLAKYVKQPLRINQMQFGLGHSSLIDSGIQANTLFDGAVDRDGGAIEYARLHDMTIQAWSPFQFGYFEGMIFDHPRYEQLNEVLMRLAEQYNVSVSAIATAWVLRHPAQMQVVLGTTKPERIMEIAKATEVRLTRPEWYALYRAAGNFLP
ncbi:MAG: aldo/keto reductase [Bacilli bacterium]